MVVLKNNGEKKNKEWVEKEKEKNDKVVTSERVEKVASEKEKKKTKKEAINKGKAIVNHPLVEHLPYPHAPSKKEKER